MAEEGGVESASIEATSRQRKRKRLVQLSTKPITFSWNVFMSFVEEDQDGISDVTKVFSQACYDKWLQTRVSKELKYPKQSFLRVLFSHVRGTDRRKPFSPNVEKAFLQVLRDKNENLLLKLLGSGTKRTGERGFTKLGFHENIQLMKENKKKKEVSAGVEQLKEAHSGERNTPVAVEARRGNAAIKSNDGVPKQENIGATGVFETPDEETFISAPTTTTAGEGTLILSKRLGVTPFALSCHTFEFWVPSNERELVLSGAQERGIDLRSSAVRFFLQDAPSQFDLRYNAEFLLPPPEECYFSPDSEIGHLVLDPGKICVYEDAKAVELFQGSSLNKHLLEMTGSIVNLMYAQIFTLPAFYQGGRVVWRRSSFKRNDGSVGFYLYKIVETFKDGFVYYYLQDVSDRYQHLAKRPEFL